MGSKSFKLARGKEKKELAIKIKNAEDTVEAMKVARRSMVKFNNAFAAGIHTQQ